MITSALISQARREFRDVPKSTRKVRDGDGSATLFNLGDFPIIEGSYDIYKGTSAQTENSDYTLDLDSGDLQFTIAPSASVQARAEYKHAQWRDKNWNEAINQSIEELNARGFFRQHVRVTGVVALSANRQVFDAPSACIDVYEIYKPDTEVATGTFYPLAMNWHYQQDANKIVIGTKPATASVLAISYLRRLQKYDATSATLDVKDDWIELLKKRSGSRFYRSLAAKIAQQGNATIEEGHFSFSNLRTQANDLFSEFDTAAFRAKPTRPAKDMQWHIANKGRA